MAPLPPPSPALLDQLTAAAESYYEVRRIAPAAAAARLARVSELEALFRTVVPDGRLVPFGSSCSGFGHAASDVDLAFLLD